MSYTNPIRPNFRRARELKAEMDEVRLEYEAACDKGNFSEAQDLKECLWEMQHALFLTGLTSEFEL